MSPLPPGSLLYNSKKTQNNRDSDCLPIPPGTNQYKTAAKLFPKVVKGEYFILTAKRLLEHFQSHCILRFVCKFILAYPINNLMFKD